MKRKLLWLFSLTLISAYAKNEKNQTLQEILLKETCRVTIVNNPIDFQKGSDVARSGQIYIGSHLRKLDKVRRLNVDRVLEISKIEDSKTKVKIQDPSIAYFCADYKEGEILDCDDITTLTIADIESLSDYNLKVTCAKDDFVIL